MKSAPSGGEKEIKKAVCIMRTAFFISFLLILISNFLVDNNVGNQSHYNQSSGTA